jgi:hypothetical protein
MFLLQERFAVMQVMQLNAIIAQNIQNMTLILKETTMVVLKI